MPNLANTLSDKKSIDRMGMLENLSGRENYPFGSLMDGRTYKTFLCNYYTKEMVDEVYGIRLFYEKNARIDINDNISVDFDSNHIFFNKQ